MKVSHNLKNLTVCAMSMYFLWNNFDRVTGGSHRERQLLVFEGSWGNLKTVKQHRSDDTKPTAVMQRSEGALIDGTLTKAPDLHLQAQAPEIWLNHLKIKKLESIYSELTKIKSDIKWGAGGHKIIQTPESPNV